jgi:FMN phosphatase YigB (HAD superfamily)
MFTFALEDAGVKKEEAMFVGHESREINAAKCAGLQTIGFNYESDVVADYYIDKFEDLLILSLLRKPE